MDNILKILEKGDMRTTGQVSKVVGLVEKDPGLVDELFSGLKINNPGLRMRVADALEKITGKQPKLLIPYKKDLLGYVSEIGQQEVQWHVAQMIPRLSLSQNEIKRAVAVLKGYWDESKSNIVKVFAMQAMFDLSIQHHVLQKDVSRLIKKAAMEGAPSIKARAKKLIKKLDTKKSTKN